ncbi:hypothetical protein MNBD_ALPHA03-851 [hydrothermal vent metagenome]|uniref:YCII-related domain-containing protein n=1 Tax=hydrothermal vent metagenome TaxID=652676 RepID=A0A3B1ATM1_9ZZZZ
MYFIILAEDKPDSLELRMNNRPAHLDYAQEQGCVTLAGPLLTEGDKPRGSMLIIDVPNRAAAEKFAANDPYAKAGFFAKVEIIRWTPAFGPWKP